MGSSQRQKRTSDSIHSLSSPWLSTKQLQLSLSECGPVEVENVNQSDSLYQKHDSSSTLSNGQSHHDASLARSYLNVQNISFQPGVFETQSKKGEACGPKPYLSWGNENFVNHQTQTEQYNSLGCTSNPYAESYFGGIITAYGPNAVVYPKLMGIAPGRVVLPLEYTEGIPVYVNAKQYHAILRRRQIRAKLEIHNKIVKSRKPYLHESRHRHALKRARGSGGRFLNTKNTQHAKPSTQMYASDLSLNHISGDTSETELHSGTNSWGASTHSGSDVSCIFNNDDILQQADFRGSVSSFHMVHNGAPGSGVIFSVDRCARISTAM